MGSGWKIQNGTIFLDTTVKVNGKRDGGDIVTDEEFENFDLKLEWKMAKNGNSGIMFCVHEDTQNINTRMKPVPKCRCWTMMAMPDGKIKKHRAGDLYDLISCSKETVKPVGEWNQVEIKLLNGKLDFYLNGENVVSTTMWDDNWKNWLPEANSKQCRALEHLKKVILICRTMTVWFGTVIS